MPGIGKQSQGQLDLLLGRMALERGLVSQMELNEALAQQARDSAAGKARRPIGVILVALGRMTDAQLSALLEEQRAQALDPRAALRQDALLGRLLIRSGHITAEQLNACLREQAEGIAQWEGASAPDPGGRGQPLDSARGEKPAPTELPRLGELLVQMGFATPEAVSHALAAQRKTMLRCVACGKRYNVTDFDPSKTYRCKGCHGALDPLPALDGVRVCESVGELPSVRLPVGSPPPSAAAEPPGPALAADSPPPPREAPSRPAAPPPLAATLKLTTPSAPPFRKYTILRELGRGGMGVVYEALDTQLNRRVALKMMLPSPNASPDEVKLDEERFLREGRLGANLPKHPNIVSVYEAGLHGGRRYIAAEFIQGRPMSDWRRMGSVTVRQQVALLRDVSLAVHHAHSHGIIHRDLKPQNVLVDTKGVAHVTDFGLAKTTGQNAALSLTASGMIVGTPTYMSPEQSEGAKTIDHRSDVWSLGVMLYEIVAGRPPFEGKTPVEVLTKVLRDPVPPPSGVGGALGRRSDSEGGSGRELRKSGPEGPPTRDRAIENICLKALAKERRERYPSAKAFAADLSTWLEGKEVKVVPPRPPRKKVSPWITAAAAAAIVAAGAWVFSIASRSVKEDLARAERLMKEERYTDALSVYGEVLGRDPDNARARGGKREAQEKIASASQGREDDLRRQAEAARREAERARKEAEAKAKAEAATTLDVERRQLAAERRALEERAKTAEESARKADEERAKTAEEAVRMAQERLTSESERPSAAAAANAEGRDSRPARTGDAPAKPDTGNPSVLPGGALHWEAEDYTGGDNAREGVDYHDTTTGNAYRAINADRAYRSQDVDIEPCSEGGYNVGWVDPGEWLRYRLSGSGAYRVELRYDAWGGGPHSVRFEVDGENVTGSIALPLTRDVRAFGTQAWATAMAEATVRRGGEHSLKLVFEAGAGTLNVNYFRFLPKDAPRAQPPVPPVADAIAAANTARQAIWAALVASKARLLNQTITLQRPGVGEVKAAIKDVTESGLVVTMRIGGGTVETTEAAGAIPAQTLALLLRMAVPKPDAELKAELNALVAFAAPRASRVSSSAAPQDAVVFGGHSYKYFGETVTWNEAKKRCEGMGGCLVCVETAEEQQFLEQLLKAHGSLACWLGGTDEAREGTWVWLSGHAMVYANWAPGEPNNSVSPGQENYLEMADNGKWNDNDDISGASPRFVCEWETAGPAPPAPAAFASPAEAAGAASQATAITVPATRRWTDSGMDVQAGDWIQVTSAGEWKTNATLPPCGAMGLFGADIPPALKADVASENSGFTLPGANLMGLLGRIGDGNQPFILYGKASFVMPSLGRLWLGPNDSILVDNVGELHVSLRRGHAEPHLVPDAAHVREAEAEVRKRFKSEYTAKTPPDRLSLALKLLDAAHGSEPTLKYVMLRDAKAAATQAEVVSVAIDAILLLGREFSIDVLKEKLGALDSIAKESQRPEVWAALAEAYLTATAEMDATKKGPLTKVLAQAEAAARKTMIGSLIGKVRAGAADLGIKLPDPGSVTIRVPSTAQWTNTGLSLSAGEKFSVECKGKWRTRRDLTECDEKGAAEQNNWSRVVPTENMMCLLARIGEQGMPFAAYGKNAQIARNSGRLFLGPNDPGVVDNEGELTVTIVYAH